MAARITHLTRGNDAEDAFKNLWKILVDKKLNGSGNSGFINGERKAVCLQELVEQCIKTKRTDILVNIRGIITLDSVYS